MPKKMTKKQEMTNTLIADLICANIDYEDGKITEETLAYLTKTISGFAMQHLDGKYCEEFCKFETVKKLRQKYIFGDNG